MVDQLIPVVRLSFNVQDWYNSDDEKERAYVLKSLVVDLERLLSDYANTINLKQDA